MPLIPTRGNIWAFLAVEAMYYVYDAFGRSTVMEQSLPLAIGDGSACTAYTRDTPCANDLAPRMSSLVPWPLRL